LFGVGILLSISRDRQGGQDSSGPRVVRKRGVVTE
jgi:cell division protein FtsW